MKRRGLRIEEVSSHLPLQVLLYFNALFSFCFMALEITNVAYKLQYYQYESNLLRLLTAPALVLWTVAEAFRLFFGFRGNLAERVPLLAAFLIVSFFPQLPCILFLSYFQGILLPFDIIGGTILFVFLLAELGFGYQALRRLIRKQTSQFFRLVQEDQSLAE
uniref:Transmembrane protein 17 n=1 Tax=Pinguiococcus pyrenoidosus TaxID=172671 RepID=A0A7R9UGE4_9STRA|mmetsp:Transcript_9160/g.34477  ORF Transcript_9160/g.34477 Transcript_9160/m.34477 type:complete len:162 (+) Transcript_9160:133-618(+)